MRPEICHVSLLAQKDYAQNILALQFQPKRKINVSELQKIDTVVGDGTEAVAGNDVDVHYTGWLFDENAPEHKGQKFDSSLDRGQLFNFPLGAGHVIKGWDEGVQGMKIGGKRTLIIPSEMGYGPRGAGGVIPPNATLVFDVELHGVN
jgi:FKBP-type peptidyl-prolyl cis-trans isomerase